jgi:hypothetical protein
MSQHQRPDTLRAYTDRVHESEGWNQVLEEKGKFGLIMKDASGAPILQLFSVTEFLGLGVIILVTPLVEFTHSSH